VGNWEKIAAHFFATFFTAITGLTFAHVEGAPVAALYVAFTQAALVAALEWKAQVDGKKPGIAKGAVALLSY